MLKGNILALIIAVAGGIAGVFQSIFNANLSKVIGDSHANFVTHLGGTLVLVVILITGIPKGGFQSYREAPWYLYLGGVLGVFLIFTVIYSLPKIGVVASTAAFIVGQMVLSTVIDHFGWLGVDRIPFSFERIIGIGLLFLGLRFIMK